ncbi:hypothetical protein K439DRAFT_1619385 [Ramaria rubella]|nr:hypothetical protein K439DRAFT_1619385 [Ramaria rubella]
MSIKQLQDDFATYRDRAKRDAEMLQDESCACKKALFDTIMAQDARLHKLEKVLTILTTEQRVGPDIPPDPVDASIQAEEAGGVIAQTDPEAAVEVNAVREVFKHLMQLPKLIP